MEQTSINITFCDYYYYYHYNPCCIPLLFITNTKTKEVDLSPESFFRIEFASLIIHVLQLYVWLVLILLLELSDWPNVSLASTSPSIIIDCFVFNAATDTPVDCHIYQKILRNNKANINGNYLYEFTIQNIFLTCSELL